MSDAPIEFYSAAWCGDCVRARALLEHYGVDFNYHDIDASDEAKAKAIEISGLQKIPVLQFTDGTFLSEPSSALLEKKLTELDLI
jgi:Glutaredoxin and related proteins